MKITKIGSEPELWNINKDKIDMKNIDSIEQFFKCYKTDKMNSKEIGYRYFTYAIANHLPMQNTHKNNIIIVPDDMSIEYATKRAFLVSEGMLLSNHSDHAYEVAYIDDHISHDASGNFTSTNLLFRCGDLSELGEWIRDTKELFLSGCVSYIPNTFTRVFGYRNGLHYKNIPGEPFNYFDERDIFSLADTIISNKNISSLNSSNLYRKLLNTALVIE